MFPPAADSSIYKRYKAIATELSKVMEATARQDLEGHIGCLRRHVPADSTAGVSLSGLTESSVAAMVSNQGIDRTAVQSCYRSEHSCRPRYRDGSRDF